MDLCDSCRQIWTDELFRSCVVDRSNELKPVLNQDYVITYGCVANLLKFLESQSDDTDAVTFGGSDGRCCLRTEIFADVLRQLAAISVDRQLMLKAKLPQIKSIKRSLQSVQNKGNINWCCVPADIIYVKQPHSAAERKKRSRQNLDVAERERIANAARAMKYRSTSLKYRETEITRMRLKRLDPDYQQAEKSRMKQKRSDPQYRQAEKGRMIVKRLDPEYRQTEKLRMMEKRSDPVYQEAERFRMRRKRLFDEVYSKGKREANLALSEAIKRFHSPVDNESVSTYSSRDQLFHRYSQNIAAVQWRSGGERSTFAADEASSLCMSRNCDEQLFGDELNLFVYRLAENCPSLETEEPVFGLSPSRLNRRKQLSKFTVETSNDRMSTSVHTPEKNPENDLAEMKQFRSLESVLEEIKCKVEPLNDGKTLEHLSSAHATKTSYAMLSNMLDETVGLSMEAGKTSNPGLCFNTAATVSLKDVQADQNTSTAAGLSTSEALVSY